MPDLPDNLPPDPMESAGSALVDVAKNKAKNQAMREVRTRLKAVLPRFLWPLIPGQRGSVGESVKREVSKRIWAAITGCLFTVIFTGVVASVILCSVLAVVWSIVMG